MSSDVAVMAVLLVTGRLAGHSYASPFAKIASHSMLSLYYQACSSKSPRVAQTPNPDALFFAAQLALQYLDLYAVTHHLPEMLYVWL